MNVEKRQRVTRRLAAGVAGDILLSYALLAVFTAAGAWLSARAALGIAPALAAWCVSALAAVPVAIGNSLAIHRLSLFIHSAVHWELAPTKAGSDLTFKLLVAWFLGTHLPEHRSRHFAHHKKLGDADDPEDLYSPLFSWQRVRVMLTQRESFGRTATGAQSKSPFAPVAKLVHIGVLAALCVLVDPGFAFMAWAVPVLIGFPLVAYLRNYCEHHPLPGEPVATSRNFAPGVDAFFLGAAGFRWHELHHADPGVHYLELGRGAVPADHSYAGILRRLLRAALQPERARP